MLTFTGPTRRFKRLCEYFQMVLTSSNRGQVAARRISSDLASNSSSSSYNSIDGSAMGLVDDVRLYSFWLHSSITKITIKAGGRGQWCDLIGCPVFHFLWISVDCHLGVCSPGLLNFVRSFTLLLTHLT